MAHWPEASSPAGSPTSGGLGGVFAGALAMGDGQRLLPPLRPAVRRGHSPNSTTTQRPTWPRPPPAATLSPISAMGRLTPASRAQARRPGLGRMPWPPPSPAPNESPGDRSRDRGEPGDRRPGRRRRARSDPGFDRPSNRNRIASLARLDRRRGIGAARPGYLVMNPLGVTRRVAVLLARRRPSSFASRRARSDRLAAHRGWRPGGRRASSVRLRVGPSRAEPRTRKPSGRSGVGHASGSDAGATSCWTVAVDPGTGRYPGAPTPGTEDTPRIGFQQLVINGLVGVRRQAGDEPDESRRPYEAEYAGPDPRPGHDNRRPPRSQGRPPARIVPPDPLPDLERPADGLEIEVTLGEPRSRPGSRTSPRLRPLDASPGLPDGPGPTGSRPCDGPPLLSPTVHPGRTAGDPRRDRHHVPPAAGRPSSSAASPTIAGSGRGCSTPCSSPGSSRPGRSRSAWR